MGTQITAPHPATQLYWGEMVPFAREGRMVLEFLHESNHAFGPPPKFFDLRPL